MEKTDQLPKALTLTTTVTRYLNRNSYFYSYKKHTKHEKTIMAVLQICVVIPFTFARKIKNQIWNHDILS